MTERTKQTVQALRLASDAEAMDQQETQAVQEALEQPMPPIFNTHSQGFIGRLLAEERSIKDIVADIDAKIADLQAQRTDAMLAESGVTAAINAIKSNR